MSTYKADLIARLSLTETLAAIFGTTPSFNAEMSVEYSLGHGTTAGLFDRGYVREHTIASNTNLDLDLNGVLLSALGEAIPLVEMVALFVINKPRDASAAANTTNLTIGGGSNPVLGFLGGTTPTIGPIRPGGFVFLGAVDATALGAVAAGTGDILRIANSSGAAATIQVGILGRTA